MKKPNFFAILLTALSGLPTAHATIAPYAEYHLGEDGSLGNRNYPLDSSGNGRSFDNDISGPDASVGTAGVVAPDSTAFLDTSGGGNEGWYRGDLYNSMPTDNFAFGIFVSVAENTEDTQGTVLALGNSNGSFKFALEGNGWQASALNVAYIGDGSPITANTWVHLAVIRSAGVSTFYVDGVQVGGTYNGAPVHNTPHLSVNPGGSAYFDGKLDEARIVTFTPGETTAKILTSLQQGVVPTSLVEVGSTATFKAANLSTDEQSFFRLGGAVTDFATIRNPNELSVVAGTAPKHIINITQLGPIGVGTYPLIKYSGTLGGLGFAGLQLGPLGRLTGTLVNNTTTSTIELQITGSTTGDLTWTGANGGAWDVDGAINWKFTSSGVSSKFFGGDSVLLNDTAATGALTLAGTVTPSSVTISNNSPGLAYSLSGTGISGAATVTKSGNGTVTFNNPNSYTGMTQINAGTVRVATGGAIGVGPIVNNGALVFDHTSNVSVPGVVSGSGTFTKAGTGVLTLTGTNTFTQVVLLNGGTLKSGNTSSLGDIATGTVVAAGATLDTDMVGFGAEPLTINGSGVGGLGAIINSSANGAQNAVQFITLASDSTVGGTSRWDVRGGSSTVSGDFTLTKIGNMQLGFVDTDVTLKSIDVNAGLLSFEYGTAVNNTHPGSITVNTGGTLGFGDFGNSISCAKPIVLNGGVLNTTVGGNDGSATIAAPVTLAAVSNGIGAQGGATLTLGGSVSGSGSLDKTGGGKVVLGTAPAYTGNTRISDGTLSLSQAGLDDTSTVEIPSNGVLDLNFSGDDQVASLVIGTETMPGGRYDASHSSGRFTGAGTLVVQSSAYQIWEAANGIVGAGADADSDNDGVENGIEFVVGGDPSSPDSNSIGLLPTSSLSATHLTFVFRRTDASIPSNPQVQFSTNLTSWTPAVNGEDGVSIAENATTPPTIVTVTIPRPSSGSKLFARLRVDAR